MTCLHILSSYDEYINFLDSQAAHDSPECENIVLFLNCEALARYVRSQKCAGKSTWKILIVPPYERALGVLGRINIMAERIYFQKTWQTLLQPSEIARLERLCVYANFMNGPTASLIHYYRKKRGDCLRIVFYPTLPHVNTSYPELPSIRSILSLLRSRIVFGPYMRLIDIGHKTILSIAGSVFDEIVYIDRKEKKSVTGHIAVRGLSDGNRKVVFACQPLLKNNRVTPNTYSSFLQELCKVLSDLDIEIIFKLHPGEVPAAYDHLGIPIVTDEIPFQHIDLSAVDTILTFSSGAVLGINRTIISCTALLEFCSVDDKREIDRLFDLRLANAGQAAPIRPASWEDLIYEIKKSAHSRA